MIDLAALAIEDFSAHVGKTFKLLAENGDCEVLLKEVRDAKRYAREGQTRTPFSLFFEGPAGISFMQGTYTLEHEELGGLAIFLVPVAIEDGSILLEAVFT